MLWNIYYLQLEVRQQMKYPSSLLESQLPEQLLMDRKYHMLLVLLLPKNNHLQDQVRYKRQLKQANCWWRSKAWLVFPSSKTKPTIYAKRENLATVGEIGRVVCEAISVPPVNPKGVEWFHSGGLPVIISDPQNRKQGGGKSKFSVSEQRTKEGVTSTLVIAGVSDEDFGEYTCRVTNNLGTHSKVLLLKRFRKFTIV